MSVAMCATVVAQNNPTEVVKHVSPWQAHSDSAWQVALPIVVKEHKEGRPYVPWAFRPYDLEQAEIPAFPGAEGGGMYTAGGRGGRVLVVTNLNDDGPGSLRWACEQGGARIIVFNVAGIIRLKSPIILRAPYVTIAGQTAPGDGICLAGESFWINTHDVVMRYMRFRRGAMDRGRRDDCLGGNPVGNIMIDHCSFAWGLDENVSIYRHMLHERDGKTDKKHPTVNVTIQNSISAKALDTYNHAFGSTIGGENTTFMRNLWACNTSRNPSIGWGGVFGFVNNVVYNWVNRTADGGEYSTMSNFINNYYKPGPATPEGPISYRIIRSESRSFDVCPYPVYGRVYAEGNIIHGNERVTRDNWDGGIQIENGSDVVPQDIKDMMRAKKPFAMAPVTILPKEQTFETVLSNVGATIPKRDLVDQRVIDEVRTGVPFYVEPKAAADEQSARPQSRRMNRDSYKRGIITDPAQMGGYPEYKGKPYKDTDGDGMPDAWEKAHGLNPNNPADATQDCTGDGYTNIEKYINAIPTDRKTDWRDLKNNHDTLSERGSL